jgi:hypothetical protein
LNPRKPEFDTEELFSPISHRNAADDRLVTEPRAKSNQFKGEIIRDLCEIKSLEAVWKCWQETRDSNFDFFSGMVRSRGYHCRPHVIVLNRHGRPDAVLVGLRERKKVPFNLCAVTICQPEVNVLEFVYGGLLGNASKENCMALIQSVIRSLADGEADMAVWEQLDVRSPLYPCALRLPSLVLRDHSHCLQDHWFMNCPKSLDSFLSSLGPTQRSKLSRKYRKVLNGFGKRSRVRSFQTSRELEEAVRDMDEIARKSVKRRLGFGFVVDPDTREQFRVESARGWLRIYILYLDEKPVAFWKGTLYNRCLKADHVGFDQTWSAFSPGIFLLLNILDKLQDDDVETIDLGCGTNQFRQCFGDERRPEARIQICAPNLAGLQLNFLNTLSHRATRLARHPSLAWARTAIHKSLWRFSKLGNG